MRSGTNLPCHRIYKISSGSEWFTSLLNQRSPPPLTFTTIAQRTFAISPCIFAPGRRFPNESCRSGKCTKATRAARQFVVDLARCVSTLQHQHRVDRLTSWRPRRRCRVDAHLSTDKATSLRRVPLNPFCSAAGLRMRRGHIRSPSRIAAASTAHHGSLHGRFHDAWP